MNERQQRIYEILKKQSNVTVEQLTAEVYASEATVRRDLDKMEKQGVLIRTWGGAALANKASGDPPAFVRFGANLSAKKKIALAATDLIKDHMSLFLASGTTVTELSKLLLKFNDLTVITNGLDIINALQEHMSVNIIVPGGELYEHYDFVGTMASNNISKFSTDILMFSCSGISEDGITLNDFKRLDMIQKMHENAKKTVLLIDTGKAGTTHTYKGIGFDEIDYVIMEKKPDNALAAKLGKKLIIAEKTDKNF